MTIELRKSTESDKRRILEYALYDLYKKKEYGLWMQTFDDEYIYFGQDEWENDYYISTTYGIPYTFSGTKATLDAKGLVEMVNLSNYQPVSDEPLEEPTELAGADEEESTDTPTQETNAATVFEEGGGEKAKPIGSGEVLNDNVLVQQYAIQIEDLIEKSFGTQVMDAFKGVIGIDKSIPVMKQRDELQMISYEPLYIAADEVDGVGDTVSREDIDGMVEAFNKANEAGHISPALFHKHKTDCFTIGKAFVNQFEVSVAGGTIPEGQPIVPLQFKTKKAWNLRLTENEEDGLMGPSIGCNAEWETIDA